MGREFAPAEGKVEKRICFQKEIMVIVAPSGGKSPASEK